jgi:ribose transport system ATP-binding protein
MTESRALLEVRDLTKAFGGALALDHVDLTVLPGEVHGLLGENGSGKSTLIKILAGYHDPDAGALAVNGQAVNLPLRSGEYRRLGFEFVHQDLGLVNSLSVVENLFMSEIADPRNAVFFSWGKAAQEAGRIFRRYSLAIDPKARVEDIRPVERAMVAIVRALEGLSAVDPELRGRTLLVLDEPTVFLPRHEILTLFDFIRNIANTGSSVLFVSHDLDEVLQITDRITVLRDGRVAGTVLTADTTPRQLVRLIIGRDLADAMEGDRGSLEERRVVLRVRNLTTQRLSDVSFDLHEGEVLGMTGLVGSGFEDVPYALYGAIPATDGTMVLEDEEFRVVQMTPHRALANGIALVPADRPRQGSVASLSASDNINMPVLGRYFRRLHLRRRELHHNARGLMTAFDVRPARPGFEYGSFSGGNQQKAMMAKWHQISPRVMLLHEPTQGVDVGARQQIFSLIIGASETTATLCASSDYEQLAAICDRVGVIADGRIAGFLRGAELTKEQIADFCLRSSIEPSMAAITLEQSEPIALP